MEHFFFVGSVTHFPSSGGLRCMKLCHGQKTIDHRKIRSIYSKKSVSPRTKQLFEGWHRREEEEWGEVKEDVLREEPLKHMKEKLEAGKGKRRWKSRRRGEEIITFILWFSVWGARRGEGGVGGCSCLASLHEEGGREVARSTAPVPPHYYGSTLIDKAACWRGTSCWQDLRRLFTEELVWSKAPLALLYGKHSAFDVSLPLNFFLTYIFSVFLSSATSSDCWLTLVKICIALCTLNHRRHNVFRSEF